jgi:pyruvate dehydrogenase phosphatase
MEAQIQTGEKPDFLIMASDGLWDNISSENAVICVQQWLEKYSPVGVMERDEVAHMEEILQHERFHRQGPGASLSYDTTEDDDTYYDENEKCLRWRVTPKHFVVEDDNCGIHLIKNALGGSRRNLFCGIVGVQPPLSRNVRDDITVQVLFFGVDVKQDVKKPDSYWRGRINKAKADGYLHE